MERTTEQERKPAGKHKHQSCICKRIFSCEQELDKHMQNPRLNKGESTTGEPLCFPKFISRNSNLERGACSSVVATAGGGESVDSSPPPPPQWRTEEEYVAHCHLELSNSSTERAPLPNENLPAPRKLCSCGFCNKVFISHQALSGHRATHKNVKGCHAASLEIKSLDANNKQLEHQNNNVNNQNNMARSSPEKKALSIVPLAENWP